QNPLTSRRHKAEAVTSHVKNVGKTFFCSNNATSSDRSRACEGALACSTCHMIVTDVDYYNKLEDPVDEENDMLDLASRLGCQVIASPDLDGIRSAPPSATRNFAVDDSALVDDNPI
ncbi:hypothetical protein E2562_025364, partial [Oryza meyeriana var. granulata]